MKIDDIDLSLLLKNCGERLTIDDIHLIDTCARMTACKKFLEIGSAGGCSTVVLGNIAVEKNSRLYCIDPKLEGRWHKNTEAYHSHITWIEAYSPWIDVPANIAIPIDFILIDGLHKTRWMLVDYHYFFPYVTLGGIIVFHDWNQALPSTDGWEVKRALEIIMETDADKLELVMEAPGKSNRGSIAFRKVGN